MGISSSVERYNQGITLRGSRNNRSTIPRNKKSCIFILLKFHLKKKKKSFHLLYYILTKNFNIHFHCLTIFVHIFFLYIYLKNDINFFFYKWSQLIVFFFFPQVNIDERISAISTIAKFNAMNRRRLHPSGKFKYRIVVKIKDLSRIPIYSSGMLKRDIPVWKSLHCTTM